VGKILQNKRNCAFCGIDMHKEQHTAVLIDCWMKKLGEITFENRPQKFDGFIREAKKLSEDKTLIFGLEDTRGFGRNLATYLKAHKYIVKDIYPALGNAMRLSSPTVEKNDAYDAFCVARILRDMVDKLPDTKNEDIFFTIRQIVKRRDSIKKRGIILQSQLHDALMYNYPSYRKFFCDIDSKTALCFWENYPSPGCLSGIKLEDLAETLRKASNNACSTKKAQAILSLIAEDGEVKKAYQQERDFIIQGIVKEIRYLKQELTAIDTELRRLIQETGYKLQTMPGIDVITEAQIISDIGDINRFPNADKLARFAGVAPVLFSSAGKGREQRSRQGNRNLNGVLYFLAIQMIQVSRGGKARHPVFHEYYKRKLAEGKRKPQALVCIQRRVLNIIYAMMKNKTEYQAPNL